MDPYYHRAGITIHHGNCLDVMRELPADSVTAVVTDPPYGLSFMGKEWDHGVPGEPFWREALRVAKPGSMLLAFGGTRTYHRLTCAIEDAGWEIRDCLSWLYGSGFPKSLDVSKAIDKAAGAEREETGRVLSTTGNRATGSNALAASGLGAVDVGPQEHRETLPATDAAQLWHGYGTALKPAWEPIVLAMKPLDGTFAANALEHGVAGLNVDGCRIGTDEALGRMNNARAPEDGTSYVVQRERKLIDNSGDKGRWPANLILDELAARALDDASGELTGGKPRDGVPGGHTFGGDANEHNRSGTGHWPGDSGGASRFFYTAKADKADRSSDGWALNTHPTVKPTDLMRWLVRLVSSPRDTVVLDPFMGSGSTIVAARDEHLQAVGIELQEPYCAIAAKRLAQEVLPFG